MFCFFVPLFVSDRLLSFPFLPLVLLDARVLGIFFPRCVFDIRQGALRHMKYRRRLMFIL